MKYITKEWSLDAFEYDPYGLKPDWFQKLLSTGKAFEYPKLERPYVEFQDKRDHHKAYVGDWIIRDVFGRRDVWSAKTFAQRTRLAKEGEGLKPLGSVDG